MKADPLDPWMHWVLRFVAVFNLLAGLNMLVFYHESFKAMGVDKPQLVLPVQLVGVLVGLFGIGYWMVDRRPAVNRDLLLLGFASKALGTLLALYHVILGNLPWTFLILVFFADVIYLPPFALILRRLYAGRAVPSAAS